MNAWVVWEWIGRAAALELGLHYIADKPLFYAQQVAIKTLEVAGVEKYKGSVR